MYEYLIKKDGNKTVIVGDGKKITIIEKGSGLVDVNTEEITENEYLIFKIELLEKRVAELERSNKGIKISHNEDDKYSTIDINSFIGTPETKTVYL